MQKHSLSLCLIMRDEEEIIGRTLKSVLSHVDEVVAVDFESHDNTRLIVEGYGARVVDGSFGDDYARARNAGVAAAYGDWILVLDPGEVLEQVRPVDLGRLLADPDALAYYCRVRREDRSGAKLVRDELRLFRNLPRLRYRQSICEQIEPSLDEISRESGGECLPSSLKVRSAFQGDKVATERLRLLRQAVHEAPAEAWLRYQLARHLAREDGGEISAVRGFSQVMRQAQQAVQLLEQLDEEALDSVRWGGGLYALLSKVLRTVDRPEEALEIVERGLERHGESSPLRFEHGAALLLCAGEAKKGARLRDLARRQFESLLDGPERIEVAEIHESYFQRLPRIWLGNCALAENSLEEARNYFRRALEENPKEPAAWHGLARAAELESRDYDALQLYLKAMEQEPAHGGSWEGGIEVLARLGFVDNALSWLRRLTVLLPENPHLTRLSTQLSAEVAAEV
ncbi:MAG TPA: glycosyltransferase [Candidatus Krumholzibacteria bacterium]|nr:glycosyltransferase [Candidatus Krumholzibacteria bacterium]